MTYEDLGILEDEANAISSEIDKMHKSIKETVKIFSTPIGDMMKIDPEIADSDRLRAFGGISKTGVSAALKEEGIPFKPGTILHTNRGEWIFENKKGERQRLESNERRLLRVGENYYCDAMQIKWKYKIDLNPGHAWIKI